MEMRDPRHDAPDAPSFAAARFASDARVMRVVSSRAHSVPVRLYVAACNPCAGNPVHLPGSIRSLQSGVGRGEGKVRGGWMAMDGWVGEREWDGWWAQGKRSSACLGQDSDVSNNSEVGTR
ncbi:hypothetical protein JDV02_004028 [Purpureocillium takamizusanense]|uniref:Uncharacterized protein n=1 Tax=Purpureocillium takamizusanense TaxID=2060973 RepID=A0A9Q8VAB7_9HYPO|nr:uncharacterized protein JDV02_004028 [Purpureocillium takamizusanense]UNI17704.1 hypothetical protein JDV02_004028 [Purpureocillium takamizusanense]